MKKYILNPYSMLITYYMIAEITDSVYSYTFIKGWLCFSLCSPIMAYFTWMTKEKGIIPKLIFLGIILFTLLSDIIVFGGPRWYDIIIIIILVHLLFFKKIKR